MAGANPLATLLVPMWCKKCKVVFQTEPAGGENYTSSNRNIMCPEQHANFM
jgi:hypothetical protein